MVDRFDEVSLQFLNDLGNLFVGLAESSLTSCFRDLSMACVVAFKKREQSSSLLLLLVLRCLSIDCSRQAQIEIDEDVSLIPSLIDENDCLPADLLSNLDFLMMPSSTQVVLWWWIICSGPPCRRLSLASLHTERRKSLIESRFSRIASLIRGDMAIRNLVALTDISEALRNDMAITAASMNWNEGQLTPHKMVKKRKMVCAILSSPIWSSPINLVMRDSALRILRKTTDIYKNPPLEGVVASLVAMIADSETNLGLRHQCHTGLRDFPLMRDSKLPRILALLVTPWNDGALTSQVAKPLLSTLLRVVDALDIDLSSPLLARLGEGVGLQEQAAGMVLRRVRAFEKVNRPTPRQLADLHASVNQFISLTKCTYMHESIEIGLRRWLSNRNALTQTMLSVWQSRDFVTAQTICQSALLKGADNASQTDTARSARLERLWHAAIRPEESPTTAADDEACFEPLLRLDDIVDITACTAMLSEASRRTNQWSALTEWARLMSVSLHADCAAKLQVRRLTLRILIMT